MVRISKSHDERKRELIDTAESLFYGIGYEQTSVNAIIEKVGVSKGTFYYYFKSKEELLDTLVDRKTREAMDKINKIYDEKDLNAIGKLNKIYEVSRNWQYSNVDLIKTILEVVYKDENILLRHKMQKRSLELCIPLYTKIIIEGIEEGIFNTTDPEYISEMILCMGNNLGESTSLLFLEIDSKPENLEIIEKKIVIYEAAVERILGAPKGSLHILDSQFLRKFTKEYFSNKEKKSFKETREHISMNEELTV